MFFIFNLPLIVLFVNLAIGKKFYPSLHSFPSKHDVFLPLCVFSQRYLIFKSSATSKKLGRSYLATNTSSSYMKVSKFWRFLHLTFLGYIRGCGAWFYFKIFLNTGLNEEIINLCGLICLSSHTSVTSQKSLSVWNFYQDILTYPSNSFL